MLCVRDIMTRAVVSLTPEATIREAMETLFTNHLSGAPVVSGDRVIGLISMTDILGFLISAPDHESTRESGSLDGGREEADIRSEDSDLSDAEISAEAWEGWTRESAARLDDMPPDGDSLLDHHTVEDAMTHAVFSIAPNASVKAAARLMRKHGIHRVLVMEELRLAGIVSALDIARIVSERGLLGMSGIAPEPICDEASPWLTN